MPKWTWAGIAMIVVAIAGYWFFTHQHVSPAASAAGAPNVALATVRSGPYDVTLDEAGTIGAPAGTTSQLAFPLAGTLGSIDVHVGEHVSAGEALAALDLRSLALAAQQASADAQAASAQASAAAVDRYTTKLAVDRAALVREERLFRAGVAARKDVEAARAQLAADEADASAAGANRNAAQAQARSAGVRAQLANTDLARATLRSPVDGIVTAIMRKPGESVDPSTPVIAVGPAAQNEATLQVPSSDATRIVRGDVATVAVTGSRETAQARVSAVVPAVDPATQSATVVLAGVPSSAVAGNAITAKVIVAHTYGLLVPQAAIVQDPQSGDNVVFVQQKQKDGSMRFVQKTVTVVHENGTIAEVTGDVRSGDRVAAQGAFELLAPAGG